MYRRTKFLEILHEIRQEMALEADYEVNSFARLARSGNNHEWENEDQTDDEHLFDSFILENVSKIKKHRPKSKK
jgi:hypothetical protein